MILSARTQRLSAPGRVLFVTRILTALVVSLLLLLLGAVGSSHSRSACSSADGAVAAAVLLDPCVAVAERGTAGDDVAMIDEAPACLVEAALCIIGVLCGMVLVVFVWAIRHARLGHRPPSRSLLSSPRTVTALCHVRALTLPQLGLSRT